MINIRHGLYLIHHQSVCYSLLLETPLVIETFFILFRSCAVMSSHKQGSNVNRLDCSEMMETWYPCSLRQLSVTTECKGIQHSSQTHGELLSKMRVYNYVETYCCIICFVGKNKMKDNRRSLAINDTIVQFSNFSKHRFSNELLWHFSSRSARNTREKIPQTFLQKKYCISWDKCVRNLWPCPVS